MRMYESLMCVVCVVCVRMCVCDVYVCVQCVFISVYVMEARQVAVHCVYASVCVCVCVCVCVIEEQ